MNNFFAKSMTWLIIGIAAGVIALVFWTVHKHDTAAQKALMERPPPLLVRIEVSRGGEVTYYDSPIENVIHIIVDENDKLVEVQLIPQDFEQALAKENKITAK
jgi:lipoate-protein ligase B